MVYYTLNSYKLRVSALQIFQALNKEKNCFFLDSALAAGNSGRYSFLGIDPFCVIRAESSAVFSQLREILGRFSFSIPGCAIPFQCGAVGYLSYDLGAAMESKVQSAQKQGPTIPQSIFALYNSVVIVDNLKRRLYLLNLGIPEKTGCLAGSLCQTNLKKIIRLLSRIEHTSRKHLIPSRKAESAVPLSNFTKAEYLESVLKVKDYIAAGDIYQLNLSQQFQAHTSLGSPAIYERLRTASPSDASGYFDAGDFQIISSSPERFLCLDRQNVVTTRPMKGTRPRSRRKSKDAWFKKQLLGSAKDKAELTMIVDLERNDLGRVCEYSSIRVRALRELEAYRTVFQTTATIEGRLRQDKDRIDLLRACFPGGSITGCPKIRAMEIIAALEPSKRCAYTGSMGYLSFCGRMDFNILIRTIVKKGNTAYFGAGGGIVADSVPEEEYQETLVKASAMFKSITQGHPIR